MIVTGESQRHAGGVRSRVRHAGGTGTQERLPGRACLRRAPAVRIIDIGYSYPSFLRVRIFKLGRALCFAKFDFMSRLLPPLKKGETEVS